MAQVVIATVIMADDSRKEGHSCVILIDGQEWWPLLRYFRQYGMPLGQQRTIAFAVSRFIQWIARKGHHYVGVSMRDEVFAAFGDDILYGTARVGEDPSDLWWNSTSPNNCLLILRRLLKFCDWLEVNYGTWHMNPWSENPTPLDQILFWRHWAKSKEESILSHIKNSDNAHTDKMGRTISYPVRETVSLKDPKAFPQELIGPLFQQGFIRPGYENHPDIFERINIRDVLITMLCLFGGLRMPSGWLSRLAEATPRIAPSTLFISCAIPPARVSRLSLLCAC